MKQRISDFAEKQHESGPRLQHCISTWLRAGGSVADLVHQIKRQMAGLSIDCQHGRNSHYLAARQVSGKLNITLGDCPSADLAELAHFQSTGGPTQGGVGMWFMIRIPRYFRSQRCPLLIGTTTSIGSSACDVTNASRYSNSGQSIRTSIISARNQAPTPMSAA